MLTSTLRNVGGSVMVAIPKSLLEGLGLAANEKVALRIDQGNLVIEPRPKPRYVLADLIAQCDLTSDDEWDHAASVGREDI
jgi:antitoxin ChpS